MRTNLVRVLLLIILFSPFNLYAQEEGLGDIDLYVELGGENPNLLFLKGLASKIDEARQAKNAKALCACSAMLFYAERIVESKHSQVDGISLLREATVIAWNDKDIPSLRAVEALWKSTVFGPADVTASEEVGKYIWKISQEKNSEKIDLTTKEGAPISAQAYLMAEEAAKTDALQQLAERIYGVMIQSLSDFKDFELKRDVVIATLKPSFLLGVQYDKPVRRGNEIQVTVTLSRSFIIKAIQDFYKRNDKKLDWLDSDKLKRDLNEQYRAVGIAYLK